MGPAATIHPGNRRADRRSGHHPAGKSRSDNKLNQPFLGVATRVRSRQCMGPPQRLWLIFNALAGIGGRMRYLMGLVLLLAVGAFSPGSAQSVRPRARDIGVAPGVFQPGPLNGITDVAGVRVGQTTVVVGDSVRTGVTAILPHGGNPFLDRVPATRRVLANQEMPGLFEASVEATEEAIYNSLFKATTVSTKVGTAEALPIDKVRELLLKYRAIER